MDEYIKREEAIKIAESYKPQNGSSFCRNRGIADYIAEDISMIPYADVAPVRHGQWICKRKGYEEYECSVCHGMDSNCSDYYADHVVTEQEYCPFCGAKMDGGSD